MFTTDYKVELVKDGTYEAILQDAKYGVTEKGTEYIALTFRIREDVEQEEKGEIVYDNLWKNKETGEFLPKRLNNLCKSAGVPEGTHFADEVEFAKMIKGSLLRINVVIKFDDYSQEDKNQILFFQKTEHPHQSLGGDVKEVNKVETKEDKEELPWEDTTTTENDDLPW